MPLKSHNEKLWNTVQQFYREIRNPVFHGSQLTDVKPEPLRCAFRMFDNIFKWIDSWPDPNRVYKNLASSTFRPVPQSKKFGPAIDHLGKTEMRFPKAALPTFRAGSPAPRASTTAATTK